MAMNGQQRDYVVPAMTALVIIVGIVAGTLVGLSLAGEDDALVLVGVLGAMAVTPIVAALVPLVRSSNRAAAAQEATAEGVEKIRHRLNGEFSAEIRQAIQDGVAPLRADIAEIHARLERGDRQLKQTEARLDGIEHQIDQLTCCERKP